MNGGLNSSLDPRLARWLLRIRVMTVKELLQFSRDLTLILFMLYAFTADVYLSGDGVSFQLREARVAVLDHDGTPASRELISRFQPPYFRVTRMVRSETEAVRLLDEGEVMLVLDVPEHFAERIGAGLPTSVQALVDTSNTVLGNFANAYGGAITARFGQDVSPLVRSLPAATEFPSVQSEPRVWYNPEEKDSWFNAVAELANIITLFAMLLPATAMVREKERGTVEQLLVTPLSPFQIMFPKVAAMTIIILTGTAMAVFGILMPVFRIPVPGSLSLFFAITAVFAFTIAGLGLLIATVARNLGQAALMAVLLYPLMMFLSGTWTPRENLPGFMLPFLYASPLTYYTEVCFGILLKGWGWALLWPRIAAMAGIGSLLFGLGMYRLRRQFR